MNDLHSADRGDKPAALGTTFTTYTHARGGNNEPLNMPRSSMIIPIQHRFAFEPDCPDCGAELTPGPITGSMYCEPCMLRADEADSKREGMMADATTGENARPLVDYINHRTAALNRIRELVLGSTMTRTEEARFMGYLSEPHRNAELRLRWGKAMDEAGFVGSEFVDAPEAVANRILQLRVTRSQSMRNQVALRREVRDLRHQLVVETARQQHLVDDLNRHIDYLRSIL